MLGEILLGEAAAGELARDNTSAMNKYADTVILGQGWACVKP
jgi:hypothetical protein